MVWRLRVVCGILRCSPLSRLRLMSRRRRSGKRTPIRLLSGLCRLLSSCESFLIELETSTISCRIRVRWNRCLALKIRVSIYCPILLIAILLKKKLRAFGIIRLDLLGNFLIFELKKILNI